MRQDVPSLYEEILKFENKSIDWKERFAVIPQQSLLNKKFKEDPMGRTILCQHCKSTFDEDVLKDREHPDACPVCGKSLTGEGDASSLPPKEKSIYAVS